MKKFVIKNSGYITCHSVFYSVEDVLDEQTVYEFHRGINEMIGDIDSGIFGISYLLSMYEIIDKNTVFLPFAAVKGCTPYFATSAQMALSAADRR